MFRYKNWIKPKKMKKLLVLIILLISFGAFSQKKFFRVYNDSAILVQDANGIVADFSANLNAISPVFTTQPNAIVNTKPFLIFYSPKSNQVNLPMWSQVIPQQKEFFYKLGGNEKKGKEIFGLFFNGFYLNWVTPYKLLLTKEKVICIKTNTLGIR
jgi:hypothetical protein